MMDEISQKIKQWIDNGKDPRSAYWQGGLESILNVFLPYLEPGRLVPVQPLAQEDMPVFLAALEVVNLSPNLLAAFLPPAIAEKVVPPESAKEIQRIAPGKPSYKILIVRPDKDQRILCAEISEYAEKPGVDIFQSGALLGTYNFENTTDCFAELAKILRTHLWKNDQWRSDDYKRYTVNWFEKVVDLHKGTVCVEQDFSFFHSPTLIKSNKIDVIFTLIYEIIQKRLKDSEDSLKGTVLAIQALDDAAIKEVHLNDLVDKVIFDLLMVMKECDLVKIDGFTDKELERFSRESARTVQLLLQYVKKL